MRIFAERFNELRGNESQQKFADRLGISRPTVGFYENEGRLPQADILAQIATRCGVSSDWLLGLSDYRNDRARNLTLDEMGFSEAAAKRLASIAGAAVSAEDLGDEADRKVSPVENPNGYSLQTEARAFLALNALLENPEFVLALSNAWAYVKHTGQIDRSKTMTLSGEDITEPFSAPCSVLVDALWHRVEEPMRRILDEMAQEEVARNAEES